MVLDLVPSVSDCNNKCSVIDTINDKDDSKDTTNHKTLRVLDLVPGEFSTSYSLFLSLHSYSY
jgi:hypothetical protein